MSIWYIDQQYVYRSLDFGGKEVDLGISLPTALQTGGYSVTDIEIYAFGVGLIAYGDIDASEGQLEELSVLVDQSDNPSLSGSGTESDPYLIQSLADFDEFAGDPNYWDDHISLEVDIDLAGRTYTTAVIAPDTDNENDNWYFDSTPFTGVFAGNGHVINNLTIDMT